jgi:hypothetical protein
MFLLNRNSILRFWSNTNCDILNLTSWSFCKWPRNFIIIFLIIFWLENILMFIFFSILILFLNFFFVYFFFNAWIILNNSKLIYFDYILTFINLITYFIIVLILLRLIVIILYWRWHWCWSLRILLATTLVSVVHARV